MKQNKYSISRKTCAWGVHIFTGLGALIAILTLTSIYQQKYIMALWLMGISIFIDGVDGSLARKVNVKEVLPNIDGALLDNIVDYLNYVITPVIFLHVNPKMLSNNFVEIIVLTAIVLTSAYQFCQADAKTADNFFKGFPCYWNIIVFYMFILESAPILNLIVLSILCVMIFIPIKYVYPSRLDCLTSHKFLKFFMHIYAIIFGLSSIAALYTYPNPNKICLYISGSYVVIYMFLSIYRTFKPLQRI